MFAGACTTFCVCVCACVDDDSSGDDPGSPTKYHDVDSDGKARSPSLAQRTQHHLTAASSVGSGMVPVPGMGEDLGVPARCTPFLHVFTEIHTHTHTHTRARARNPAWPMPRWTIRQL